MKQRREDARNIALIVGSGALGAVATVVGMSLMGSFTEAPPPPPAPAVFHLTEFHPNRFRTEVSFREVRSAQEQREAMQRAIEAATSERIEAVVAELEARSEALQGQQELRISLDALRASMEEMEGTVRQVRIRTIGGDPEATPVIYVDGVRFEGALADLGPEDIESIDVLKGDAAVERYGEEGENGVIIIKKRKRRGGGGR